jgi:hypothetical protein
LAALGAARIGERRLKEVVAKCGRDVIRQFIEEWFDYSGRRLFHPQIARAGAHQGDEWTRQRLRSD